MRSTPFQYATVLATTFLASAELLFAAEPVFQPPTGFEQVDTIHFTPDQITLKTPTGQSVTVPAQHEFLKTGSLRQSPRPKTIVLLCHDLGSRCTLIKQR